MAFTSVQLALASFFNSKFSSGISASPTFGHEDSGCHKNSALGASGDYGSVPMGLYPLTRRPLGLKFWAHDSTLSSANSL